MQVVFDVLYVEAFIETGEILTWWEVFIKQQLVFEKRFRHVLDR